MNPTARYVIKQNISFLYKIMCNFVNYVSNSKSWPYLLTLFEQISVLFILGWNVKTERNLKRLFTVYCDPQCWLFVLKLFSS